MKPRKVPSSNKVYSLPGGNEDNDLWSRLGTLDDGHVDLDARDPLYGSSAIYIAAVYEPTNEERAGIASGLLNLELVLLGLDRPPPVILRTTDEQPKGKALTHGAGDAQRYVWQAIPLELAGVLLDLSNPDTSDGVRRGLTSEPIVAEWRKVLEAGYLEAQRLGTEEPGNG